MVIREATAADAPRVREIVRAAYAPYVERMGREPRPMQQDYDAVLRDLDCRVAVDGDAVVGFLAMDDDPDEGYLVDNVAVDPARRGTGVGRRLLELGEALARDRGLDRLRLYTHSTMTENLGLYGRIGYVEYGRRPSPPGEVVLLEKRL